MTLRLRQGKALVMNSFSKLKRYQIDRDLNVAARGVGIRAQLVRRVHKSLSHFALQTRQADVETCREDETAVSRSQVHFGVNSHLSGEGDLPFAGRELYRTEETN
jgi:hypothetical protein